MENKKEEYNPLSYNNHFFKYLEENNIHPVEYMDLLFQQRRYLIDIIIDSKIVDEKNLCRELTNLNPQILDKLHRT